MTPWIESAIAMLVGKGIIDELEAAEWVNPHPDRQVESEDLALPTSSTAKGAALFAISGVRAR